MDDKQAQEALIDGQARFEEWAKKFMDDWQLAGDRQGLKMIYSQLPAEAKDAMKQQDPKGYETMTRFFNKK